jgi:hypothetical protein
MNQNLSDILVENFPLTYSGSTYFECGDGWFALIYRLSQEIEKFNRDIRFLDREAFTLYCCKEKFGTLRFQMNYPDDAEDFDYQWIGHLTSAAQEMSKTICEDCGEPGKMTKGGWIKVRCGVCK